MSTTDIITWWNMMSFEDQFYKVIEYLSDNDRNTTELHPHSMTFEEITEVYLWQQENM